jgi:hypothetical protein
MPFKGRFMLDITFRSVSAVLCLTSVHIVAIIDLTDTQTDRHTIPSAAFNVSSIMHQGFRLTVDQ